MSEREPRELVASNVQGKIISGSGHWLMDEAPQGHDSRSHNFPQRETLKRPKAFQIEQTTTGGR